MPGETILIVDDDDELRTNLSLALEYENFKVYQLDNGKDLINFISDKKIDLIILDLILRDSHGVELLKEIRKKDERIPVIVLSAKKTESSKVTCLTIGADDYITKPFSSEELIARVNTNFRRIRSFNNNSNENRYLFFGSLKLDTGILVLYKENDKIKLNSRLFKLLKFFMENPERVFTKRQIYDNVWGDDYFVENTVTIYIRKLRQIIEKDPNTPEYLQTIWGMGYKLTCE